MSARNRKLRMEQVEDRRLMAVTGTIGSVGNLPVSQDMGDVADYVQNGNLYVNEAATHLNSANGVAITQVSPGHIRVAGTAAAANGVASVVNGQAYQDFAVTGNLYVNLGGGGDSVQIGAETFNGLNIPSFNEIHIDTSAPQPVVSSKVKATTTTALNIPDNDFVAVLGAHTLGDMTINTGAGDDNISVENAVIGDGAAARDLIINSGAGSDLVSLTGVQVRRNLDIQTYSAVTENDVDVLYLNLGSSAPVVVGGCTSIRMGGGNDHIFATDPTVFDLFAHSVSLQSHGSVTIDTGAGDDTAFLRNIRTDSDISINMGAGTDTLEMRAGPVTGELGIPAAAAGQINVQMYSSLSENDVDNVTLSMIHSGGTLSVKLGGGNDVLALNDVKSDLDVNLDAGTGNDTVRLVRVAAVDNFFANLGDGDDVLATTDLFGGGLKNQILGGNGIDRMTRTGAFPVIGLTQTGWEYINGLSQAAQAQAPVKSKK
jgi:hypothetical protein